MTNTALCIDVRDADFFGRNSNIVVWCAATLQPLGHGELDNGTVKFGGVTFTAHRQPRPSIWAVLHAEV